MDWSFGSARSLYARKRHPRLLVGPEGIEDLRVRIRSGKGRTLMQALRAKVEPMVAALLESRDVEDLLAHHTVRKDPRGTNIVENLADVGLVAALDAEPRTIRAVRRALAAVPAAEKRGPRDTYRLGYASWGAVQLAYDLAFDHLPRAEQIRFARWAVRSSIRETLTALNSSAYLRSAGANIPMAGMITAMLSLMAVEGDPGTPRLERERKQLLRYLEASLFSMMGPQGYPAEDIGYGSGMVSLISRVVEAARRAGLYDVYASCPRYARFGRAMLHTVQPWGKVLSNTGDYGADFGWLSLVFPRMATETGDPTLLWLEHALSYPIACSGPADMAARRALLPEVVLPGGLKVPVDAYSLLVLDDLRKPVPPSRAGVPTQYMDSARGIVTFRSSWEKDATFVLFDGAQRSTSAQGHAHDSGGHFSLSALGEHFAIDTGRYNIEQDQHNVVLVDGKSGQSTDGQWRMTWYHANLTEYEPGGFVDVACVDNSQMSNCYWSRRWLGLVKDVPARGTPAYVWTVDDVNFANDYRQFWWTMNVNPDHRIELAGRRATVVGSDHGNCLDVFYALPGPAYYPKPHELRFAKHMQRAGSSKYLWEDVRKLDRDYRRMVGNVAYGPVFLRPRLVARVKGYNGRFMFAMVPRLRGARVPDVAALPAMDNALAMRLRFDRVEDTLLFAYEHNLLEANGVEARGQWCVVRRDRRTGRVLAAQLGNGSSLRVDGRPVKLTAQ